MTDTKERTHRNACPALQAWDIPGACNCDRPALRVRCGMCGRYCTSDEGLCALCSATLDERTAETASVA